MGMISRRNGWSECTRYVAYEPGRVDRGWLKERQEGRFTFEARAMAREISRRYESCVRTGRDADLTEFHQWLLRADALDERITRLPERENGWGFMMRDLIMQGEASIHCRLCRNVVARATLVERKGIRQLPYQFDEIRCPSGHLLFRPFLIALCLAPPPGIKEALMKLRATG